MTPSRPIPWWLYLLTFTMGVAGVLAHGLGSKAAFDQATTVALVIQFAIPFVIGIAVGITRPTFGQAALRGLGLSVGAVLLAAPVMAQSLVCLIVMVPLVAILAPCVAMLTLLIVEKVRGGAVISGVLAACVMGGSIPSAHERANAPVVLLRDTVEVEGTREQVWASIDRVKVELSASVPLWQRVLLPSPTAIDGGGAEVGSLRRVSFSNGYVDARVTDSKYPESFGFELEAHDTGPEFLNHFVDLQRSEFEFTSSPEGRTRITHSTWYRPIAYPRWYFEPIEAALGSYLQSQLLLRYRDQLGADAQFVQR